MFLADKVQRKKCKSLDHITSNPLTRSFLMGTKTNATTAKTPDANAHLTTPTRLTGR